jgi:hypothetical protein
MPIYYYQCPRCFIQTRKLLAGPKEAETEIFLCKCGTPLGRSPKAPTTRITETLDNGAMVRKLERLADAEQIHHERAHGKKGNI